MQHTRHTISGEVLAVSATWDEYLQQYAEGHAEWVEGTVVRLSPVTRTHNALVLLLSTVLKLYLEATDEGDLFLEPFVMRLPNISAREPDLQVVLSANSDRIRDTFVDGPADLVIEIVSPESDTRDRVEKFSEYERGGVGEYWILDPKHREALFYLRRDGVFLRATLDESGAYVCVVLPRLVLPVDWLWQEPRRTTAQIQQAVQAMLDSAS